jgi:endonuclease III
VTESLFKKYRNRRDYAKADIKELEADIYSTGFYKSKRKIQSCRATDYRALWGEVHRQWKNW